MKRNFLLLVAVVLSVAFSGTTLAQGTRKLGGTAKMNDVALKRGNIDRTVALLKNDLKLNGAQAARVRELLVKQRSEAMSWRRANPRPTPAELQRYREAMITERGAGLNGILTQTQMKLLPPPDPEDKCKPQDKQCINMWMALYNVDPRF